MIARQDVFGDPWLVAYFVPAAGERPSVSRLRRELLERFPDYMIPSRFVPLDVLPVSENGKMLRSALPEPGAERPALETAYAAPATPLETDIAAVWSEVLQFDRIGRNDDFFDLGGDSLKAARSALRLRRSYSVDLPLSTLFAQPTVAAPGLLWILRATAMGA